METYELSAGAELLMGCCKFKKETMTITLNLHIYAFKKVFGTNNCKLLLRNAEMMHAHVLPSTHRGRNSKSGAIEYGTKRNIFVPKFWFQAKMRNDFRPMH